MRIGGAEVAADQPVHGGDICRAWRGTSSGQPVFAKVLDNAPRGLFAAEVRGLELLRDRRRAADPAGDRGVGRRPGAAVG